MRWSKGSPTEEAINEPRRLPWIEPCLAVFVGGVCAALGRAQLTATLTHSILFGALFGLCFWWGIGKRAYSPGAGLIWGLAVASLLWLLIPAGLLPMRNGTPRSLAMLVDARSRFPDLVAYLLLLG